MPFSKVGLIFFFALIFTACSGSIRDPNCNQLPVNTDIGLIGDSIFDLAKSSCTQMNRYLSENTN